MTLLVALCMLAVLLLPARAVAQTAARHAPVQFRLANGLDVILEEDHRQPRVALLVGYELGWRDDPPGLSGLAHLVEQLS